MKRVPGVKVTPLVHIISTSQKIPPPPQKKWNYVLSLSVLYRYFGKIQDKDESYYMQFHIVICGLDSVEARRWINATLVNMVDEENPESLKPLIDGGTEGMPLYSTSAAIYIFPVGLTLELNFQGLEDKLE